MTIARTVMRRTRRLGSNRSGEAVWLRQARRVLVGGVNSPVRAFRQTGGRPLMLARSRGATVVSPDGTAFTDFIMGWGAIILGHGYPAVTQALRAGLRDGVLTGLTHPAEVELARLITESVPGVEQVRFTTSGTEACMTAVRLARAVTGRTKLIMCEGGYHGHGESLLARASAGIPERVAQETLTVPYNDAAALEATLARVGRDAACVILEPVAANMGVVPPAPGYLARVRELTRSHGVLLIFDEVVTGFRVSRSGAQGLFGVRPDLTTFGKIIGGGLPIGALGGPRRLMQRLAPEGDVFHGGTFAGHPLAMAAGAAVLRHLRAQPPYERLDRLAAHLTGQLQKVAAETGVPVQINRVGSMFTVFFTGGPIRSAAEARASDRTRFAKWAEALRAEGVLVPPSPLEALFLSMAHGPREVEQLVAASRRAFATLEST